MHYWFYDKLQAYLDHHPDNNNFVTNKLIPYIRKTAILFLYSGNNFVLVCSKSQPIVMMGNPLHTSRFSSLGESTFLFSSNRFRLYGINLVEYLVH